MLVPGCNRQLGESHAGEGVGENVVRGDDGLPFTGQREVEVVVSVVAEALQESGALLRAGEPCGIFLHFVVEHGEHPDFPPLEPDELVGVKDTSVTVQTGEIASEFLILRTGEPKGQYIIIQFFTIAFRHLSKVNGIHLGQHINLCPNCGHIQMYEQSANYPTFLTIC